MIGYIDVGGGMRGSYGAGILDFCLDNNIEFPYYLGVSAGSANIISFLGGHHSRTLRFYRDYTARRECISLKSFFKNKSYINLDYIYSTLTNDGGEDSLNFDNVNSHNCTFYIVSTDAVTGETVYFNFKNMQRNDYYELKASCCIPIICAPIEKNNRYFYDGGLSDPIPVKKALADGCEKVIVSLTLPRDYFKSHKAPKGMYEHFLKKYPKSSCLMYSMIDKYNEDLLYLLELEKQGKALIIAPDNCCGVTTLKHKNEDVETLYFKGYNNAKAIIDFIK